jgi:hypothetical protein
MGVFVFQKVAKPKNDNKLQRRGKFSHLCISQIFLVAIIHITNQFFKKLGVIFCKVLSIPFSSIENMWLKCYFAIMWACVVSILPPNGD